MSRSSSISAKRLRFGCRCCSAVAITCLMLILPGCAELNLCNDNLSGDNSSSLSWPSQPAGSESEFFGVSNKAREIERNCMR